MRLAEDAPLSGCRFDDRYRTVPERLIVDMLALAGGAGEPDDPLVAIHPADALRDWAGQGLAHTASPAGERRFDPVEVWTVMKRLGRDGRDPFFHRRYVATGRRGVSDLARSAAPGGPFTLDYRRIFLPEHGATGRLLRLRLPVPLARSHPDRSVVPLDGAALEVQPNRIELRRSASSDPPSVAVRLRFSTPVRDKDADTDVYLRPREGAIVVGERVHAIARRLAGPGSTVRQAVQAFWLFLIERFLCVPVHYDQVDRAAPCDWVLDTGCYDCRLGAALFAALCRARGIPARIVGGHLLYRRAPTNHYWAEYWCREDGWVPVDFLGWDLSGGGADPAWRDRFFGRLDARLVTEVPPHDFTGAIGVAIPREWHLLQTAAGDGIEIALTALDGRPIYRDRIRLLP